MPQHPRKKYSFEETFPFGRHKGERILKIMRSDPNYVWWLHTSTQEKFCLDDEAEMLLDYHLAVARDEARRKGNMARGFKKHEVMASLFLPGETGNPDDFGDHS